jgi:hypothetical protein
MLNTQVELKPYETTPAALQTFAAESDRARLSPVAIKAFLGVAKAWDVSNRDAAELVSVSGSTFDRMKRGEPMALNQDQLTRVSALVGLYKGLHLMFADAMADQWPVLPNSGPLFKGASPLAAMKSGGIPKMLDTRRYIDAVRGGL